MKDNKKIKKVIVLAIFVFLMVVQLNFVSAVSLTIDDENFDDDGPLWVEDVYTYTFTNDGIKYTFGGILIGTIISNDSTCPLGNDGSDYYMNAGTDASLKIEAEDASSFSLRGISIDALADTDIFITPSVGTSVVLNSNNNWVTETLDFSGNADFMNISSVTISGRNLILCIDDLDFSAAVLPTYTVTYNGNNNTGGSVPVDGTSYNNGDTVTVLGNTGSLVRTGHTFAGWNTAANGSGTSYNGGDTFAMGSSNVTLYAQWTAVDYTVTYNGNTNTGGSVPVDGSAYNITDTVTVLGNTGSLVKTGYTFAGWNTAANGSGTSYNGGDTFAMGSSNVTLYAQWTENIYTVTYNGNNNTGGSVPVDGTSYTNGDTATVLGNTGSLVKTGHTFAGWNTAVNGSGTSYTGGDTFAMGSSNVTVYAQWTAVDYTVTYNGNTNTGGSVPVDGSAYNITDTVTVLGNTGSLVKTGYTFAGWNTAANGSGTSYNGGDTFAMGSSNVTLYAKWNIILLEEDEESTSTATNQDSVIVSVNGEEEQAGTETIMTEEGQVTLTVEINNKVIDRKINEVLNNNSSGTENVFQIITSDKESEITKFELTGDIVKKLEDNSFDISVKADNVEYIIPAMELTITKVAGELGLQDELQDIKIEVKLSELDKDVLRNYQKVASSNGDELIFQPINLKIFAKTIKNDGFESAVEINKFSNYVQRIMEIPSGIDSNKITTGVVFNPDGTYNHVPTTVFQKDGKWYAGINSLTNSTYSVIWNPVEVKNVEGHWSEETVKDMASRMIVSDYDEFLPDKAITRGDFAEYIVRALGLYRVGSYYENNFIDLSNEDERTLAILIAKENSLISGYPDGTFKPEKLITREEAMAMYHRAMKITKLIGTEPNRYQKYLDYHLVSTWAQSDIKDVLSAHVFSGRTLTTISPKSNFTYAEATQAVRNLLVQSKLINE